MAGLGSLNAHTSALFGTHPHPAAKIEKITILALVVNGIIVGYTVHVVTLSATTVAILVTESTTAVLADVTGRFAIFAYDFQTLRTLRTCIARISRAGTLLCQELFGLTIRKCAATRCASAGTVYGRSIDATIRKDAVHRRKGVAIALVSTLYGNSVRDAAVGRITFLRRKSVAIALVGTLYGRSIRDAAVGRVTFLRRKGVAIALVGDRKSVV